MPAADASLVAMPGPLPGMTGIRAKDGPAVIELQVSEAISTRGSIAFWLFADKAYHGGIHAEPADAFRERIIDGKLVMIADASAQLFECFMQVFSPEGLGASRRTQFPGLPGPAWYHFAFEWDFQIVKPDLAIVFFSARGRDGKDLFDPSLNPRNGDFVGYTRGDIDTYHISYYSHHRLTSNLRKNHGFYMPATGPNPEAFSSSKVRRARLMKNGGHIQMTLDDEVIIDFRDDGERYGPVPGGGRIGLRQMRGMVGRYGDFRIYEVRPDRRPSGPEVPQYGQMPSQ